MTQRTRAVFLAESDSAASGEVLATKQRLGGNAQITLDKYPRIVFGVSVSLERVLDFTKRGLPGKLVAIRQNCLAPDDLSPSMELGDLLRGRSIQGLVFRSAVGITTSGISKSGASISTDCKASHGLVKWVAEKPLFSRMRANVAAMVTSSSTTMTRGDSSWRIGRFPVTHKWCNRANASPKHVTQQSVREVNPELQSS